MGISEKAAYLAGLLKGYQNEVNPKEAEIISEMLTLLADMADKIKALEADNKDLHEYVEELDHDLGEVEEEVYFGDDYDDEYDDDDFDDEDEYEGEDGEFYEIECPSCGEIVCFDESLEVDELVCPACGEKIGDIEICDGNCAECGEDCEA